MDCYLHCMGTMYETVDMVTAHQHGALLPGVDEAVAANSQSQQSHGHSGLVINKRGALEKILDI